MLGESIGEAFGAMYARILYRIGLSAVYVSRFFS